MEKQAHARAALDLVGAAERRLKDAWKHLYSGGADEDLTQELISTSLKLYAVRMEIRLRYKL